MFCSRFGHQKQRYHHSHKTFMPQVDPIMRYTGATLLSRNRMHSSKAARSYGNRLLWGYCGCLSRAEPIYHDTVTPGERCSAGDSNAQSGATHTRTHTRVYIHKYHAPISSDTHAPIVNNSITDILAQTPFSFSTFNATNKLAAKFQVCKYSRRAQLETGKSRCNRSRHTRLAEARRV